MTSRWGFNTNATALGDEAKYLRTLDAWKPAGQVLMNGLSGTSSQNVVVRLATHLRALDGNTIYRPYEDNGREGHLWTVRSAAEHIQFLQNHRAPEWLWFQVGNEPHPDGERETRRMCAWYAELIRLAANTPLRLVVYNPPVSGFERAPIAAGWYDELLEALTDYARDKVDGWPRFMLGSHSAAYWHGVPMAHCAGRNPEDLIHPERLLKANWPKKSEIFDADTSDNWILFRDYWFVERARKLRGVELSIAATEAGPERLPNIVKDFPDVARRIDEICGQESRGAPTITKYLEWAYPGRSAAESLCDCFDFVDEMAPANYLLFAWFSWTMHDEAPDYWWRHYGASQMDAVLEVWPKRLEVQDMPVLTATPFPDNLGEPEQRVLSAAAPDDVVHGREGPGTDYALILDVPDGAVVKVWKESGRRAAGRDWYPVEYNGRRFWLAQVGYDPITRMLRSFEQQFLPVIAPPEQGSGDREEQGSGISPQPPIPNPQSPPPPAPPETPVRRKREVRITIEATDEEMAEWAATMSDVFDVLTRMFSTWKTVKPTVVIQDLTV